MPIATRPLPRLLDLVRPILPAIAACAATLAGASVATAASSEGAQKAPAKKPNILVIWGDDVGQFNVGAYNMGMMGYKTPNIDRIAKEG
ncbi:MAG: arylsulfatase, partial [Planctomycetota bacterium]